MKFFKKFDLRKMPEPDNMAMSFWVSIGVVLFALIRLGLMLAGGE
jgi:hypothetical protein